MKHAISYIFKKLWPLILLLALSAVAVLGRFRSWPLYAFLESFFRFALYVLSTGILAHFAGEALPRRFSAERGFFACSGWEKGGKVYDTLFRVTKWKDMRFDASKAFPGMAAKSAGLNRDAGAMAAAVQETCVAELTHWMLLLLSPLILLLGDSGWLWLLWAFYVLANLSDIVIQRYNRPRFLRLCRRSRRTEACA